MARTYHIEIPDCPHCGATPLEPSTTSNGYMNGRAACDRAYQVWLFNPEGIRTNYFANDTAHCLKRQLDAAKAQNALDFESPEARKLREIDNIVHLPNEQIDV